MTKFQSRSDILIFSQNNSTVLARMGTVLKFVEGPFSQLLLKIFNQLSYEPQTQIQLRLLSEDPDDTDAVLDVLLKYDLVVEITDVQSADNTLFRSICFVSQTGDFSALPHYINSVPLNMKCSIIKANQLSIPHLPTLFSQLANDMPDEIIPVFLFPFYDRGVLAETNRFLISKKRRGIILHHHAGVDTFMSYIPGTTSCLECIRPLVVSEMMVDQVLFYSGNGLSPSQEQVRTSILFQNIYESFEPGSKNGNMNLIKFNLKTLNCSLVRRITQPRCIACGTGAFTC